jgi:ribonuclease Z
MRPIFQPRLVNRSFGDPGLIVDVLHERRALLFDLGDIAVLPPRKLLRTSHVFVTHAHMDHFIGFDRLLRVCLGRARPLTLFGPEGFTDNVQHKLAAFTWNLVDNYSVDLEVTACEVTGSGKLRCASFNSRERFARRATDETMLEAGLLLDEPSFAVQCAVLDHGTPCLGFALQETAHVNVWRNRLEDLGLSPGPWLRDVKRSVLAGAPDTQLVTARMRCDGATVERQVALGVLRERALQIVAGEKIAYVSDVAFHDDNVRRITDLARDADVLYIEAMFLEEDSAEAARRRHLTARQAGTIAREAAVRTMVPFHFSPRYSDRETQLRSEAESAFGGSGA